MTDGGVPSGAPALWLDRINTFGVTDPGRRREVNEDSFFVGSLQKSMVISQSSLASLESLQRAASSEALLLVVADGLGGMGGGDLASSLAVKALTEHIANTAGCYFSLNVAEEHEFIGRLQEAVERSHQKVRRQLATRESRPASTLTTVTLAWPRAYVVHVGDSRAYHFRDGRLRQLTRDQTAAEDSIDRGILTEEQAARTGLQHMLVSAVGAEITPSVGLIDLEWGDSLLLCTDGLTKHVTDEAITAALSDLPSAEEACRTLVEAALEGGGSDNITVVVARTPVPETGT